MRKSLGPMSAVYPMPVFIISTYNEDGTPNAMNAAWGGISEERELFICMGADHKTTENLMRCPDFTVSMATREFVAECDFVGIVSGKDVPDKLTKCDLSVSPAERVNAPTINELGMALECRLKSYDPESCRLFAEIVNITADESVLTDGKLDVSKLAPITYDGIGHGYYVLGERVGTAFSDGKKYK